MSDQTQRAPGRRRISRRKAIVRVMAISLASAAALTGGLAVQMASGHDPALGSGQKAAAAGTTNGAQATQGDDGFFNSAPPAASVTTRAS
jgi:hypothetical protein